MFISFSYMCLGFFNLSQQIKKTKHFVTMSAEVIEVEESDITEQN